MTLCRHDREYIELVVSLGRVPVEDHSTGEQCALLLGRCLEAIEEAWGVVDELSAHLPPAEGQGSLLNDQGTLL